MDEVDDWYDFKKQIFLSSFSSSSCQERVRNMKLLVETFLCSYQGLCTRKQSGEPPGATALGPSGVQHAVASLWFDTPSSFNWVATEVAFLGKKSKGLISKELNCASDYIHIIDVHMYMYMFCKYICFNNLHIQIF